ncbi:MAG: response regulator [Chitinivibrionia bacterium]|nr:response regulator [Chitinivibrionia bacterium]
MAQKILWVDDEIDLLKSHIMFLESKGYSVKIATNGEDALQMTGREAFDLLLLDESMPGKGGLETLAGIHQRNPLLPVIMITKNEEERLMEEAIGMRIDDYLLKPVNPLQIYSACKRLLDSERIQASKLSQDYIREFGGMETFMQEGSWEGWLRLHNRLSEWDLEFDRYRDIGLERTHEDQKSAMNYHFGRFIEKQYPEWIFSENRPLLSVDVFKRFVAPHLSSEEHVYFIVIDCVRLDQWLVIEDVLKEDFVVEKEYYLSILPTATPYSRNALFSGLFPDEISANYPDQWLERNKDEISKNRYEEFFLAEQMKKHGFGKKPMKYSKVYTVTESNELRKRIPSLLSFPFAAFVFNFVDIMAHGRNQIDILQEIAPDESAFRSLMRSWFFHSSLLELLKELSKKKATVIMTTDHGSIIGRKSSVVHGRRDTSTNLRYKFGDNLNCDEKQAIITRNPGEFHLPSESRTKTYLFAKEYYYFVYPTNLRTYERQYLGSIQHGGASMEEMILPCLTLTPKS